MRRTRHRRALRMALLVTAVLLPTILTAVPIHAAAPAARLHVPPPNPASFGANTLGQSGLGTFDSNAHPIPTAIAAISATQVAAGWDHTLALNSGGTVFAWGHNTYGELGATTSSTCNGTSCSTTPVPVTGVGGFNVLSHIKGIAAGNEFSLAVVSNGLVVAWGRNYEGELGTGTTDANAHNFPSVVSVITNAVMVAAAGYHALALTADGRVFAWGYDQDGETGDGTFNTITPTPRQVLLPAPAKFIAAGYYHSLAVTTAGNVYAWGYGYYGELGNGTPPVYNNSNGYNSYAIPTQVVNLSGIKLVAGGFYHSLAVKSDGTLWAWGYDGYGQLGNGSATGTNFNTPQQVLGIGGTGVLSSIVSVAAGDYHSLALMSNGTAVGFGYNGYGQLGTGNVNVSSVTSPVTVTNPTGHLASAVAAGSNDSFEVLH
jgi:alpha-tubulin suppressor-like RCC1 family protein